MEAIQEVHVILFPHYFVFLKKAWITGLDGATVAECMVTLLPPTSEIEVQRLAHLKWESW